jgi:opacity protein-like surface antigen
MKHVDEIFQSAYKIYEEQPPDKLWAVIENKLDKDEITKYRSRYVKMMRVVLCITFLLLFLKLHDYLNTNFAKVSRADNFHANSNNSQFTPGDKTDLNTNKNFSIVPQSLHENFSNQDLSWSLNKFKINRDGIVNTNLQPHTQSEILNNIISKNLPDEMNLSAEKDLVEPPSPKNGNKTANNDLDLPAANKIIYKPKFHEFALTPFVSKNILNNHLEEAFEFDNRTAPEINEREKNNTSFTLGVFADYRFSKKWILNSGLAYTSIKNAVTPSFADAQQYNNSVKFLLPTTYGLAEIKNPYMPNPSPNDSFFLSGNSKQQINYVTIPVKIKYLLYERNRLSFYASLGAGINIVTKASLKVGIPDNDSVEEITAKIGGIKHTFYSGMVGLGADYKINKKISLSLQTEMSRSFTPANKNVPVKNSINNFQLIGGIKILL